MNPADAYLRGSVLEDRNDREAARDAYAVADRGLYAEEVRAARDRALAHVVESVREGDGRIVDVATGRGTLLELLATTSRRPLVATDVSPTILGRVRRRLGEERVTYVVADARELPFEDGSVPTLVSHLGLPNVAEAETLLRELRRVGHELFATHVFYREDDEENRAAARATGVETLLVRSSALAAFGDAGWKIDVEAESAVHVRPTPESKLVPGVRIDGLPVVPTTATWCVLRAV